MTYALQELMAYALQEPMAPFNSICRTCGRLPQSNGDLDSLLVKTLRERIRDLELQIKRMQHLPPRPLLPSEPSETLVFEYEDPKVYGKDKPRDDDWKIPEMRQLLAATPSTEQQWLTTRQSVLLSEPVDIFRAFLQIINHEPFQLVFSDTRIGRQVTTESRMLQTYQEFALSVSSGAARQVQISRYILVIHLCLCLVAYKARRNPSLPVHLSISSFFCRSARILLNKFLKHTFFL